MDKSYQGYSNAALAVRAGTASPSQVQMVQEMAKIAGSKGQEARDALKNAGKG